MSWHDDLSEALEKFLESPKTTIAASTYSASMGIMATLHWLTGIGAFLAVFAGLIATGILARLNWIKGENEKLRGKLLRQRALGKGIDLDEDD